MDACGFYKPTRVGWYVFLRFCSFVSEVRIVMEETKENRAISLIIPVYNVEKYLRRTLVSVENQTFKDIEVIIVNDGSTDGSSKIIGEFAEKNSNFIVLNQKNKGLSQARNAGLKVSSGDYVAFLDSDDFLEPDYLKKLYSTALKNSADIVCCNFYFYYPRVKMRIFCPLTTIPGVYSGEHALKKIISCIGTFTFAWNKLFKRELFTKYKIEFYDMYFEDIATSPQLFFYAKRVVFVTDVLYNYVMRNNSILHTMNAKKINDFVKTIGVVRNFCEKKGIYKKCRRRMRAHSKRISFLILYDLFMMHFKSANFDKFLYNARAISKSIKHFVSDDYKPGDENCPDPIFPVKSPEE
ncbi:MAG: glycosyltransferase [Oscillospiraceae bacterium]|jgi:glycosyltransferase involved in cell wall biosynthesis|nr:glycosyltransferase [Oscillospiraceae bacterium]